MTKPRTVGAGQSRPAQLAAVFCVAFSVFSLARIVNAQETPTAPQTAVTLAEAVSVAQSHFPEARAAIARMQAARAGVGLARTAYLPRTDLLWQTNRSTYNNITGLLLPQSVIPSLSGIVLPNSTHTTLWNSGTGALVSWQPFDFGLRQANIDLARAGENSANIQLQVTQLDVSTSAADAFLALSVAQQARIAADADVSRREAFAKVVHVLVQNQLRPGVDDARAQAELAAARTQLLRADELQQDAALNLAEAMGIAGQKVGIDPSALLRALPEPSKNSVPLDAHPQAELAMSAVAEFRAQRRALDRSYVPVFTLQSALSGRGSGAKPNGVLMHGSEGLLPDRYNFALGLTVSFPVFDYFFLRSRKQVAVAGEQSSRAEYEKTVQHLTTQAQRAQVAVFTAKQIAANTAVELQTAQMAETQAEARYRASLAGLTEVAEAQRLLVQAETDDSVARISVWRAFLSEAFAEGNMQPFLDAIAAAAGGR